MLLQLTEPGQISTSSSQGVVVGIDLGTTHTVVGIVCDQVPKILSLGEKGRLIPSLLSLGKEGFQVGVSLAQTLSSTKRLMGRADRLSLGDHRLSPMEVAGHILFYIKEAVQDRLGLPIEGAVITVPAYFDEAARVATKQAAALAGLKVIRLLNEPTAAALAYGLETGAEGIYAVYDFGGGTFDLSLLKLQKGIFQVLGTGGDLTLGGDDIDFVLQDTYQLSHLSEAREIKEKLSQVKTYKGIERHELERISEPFVMKTLEITTNVLKEANLVPEEIHGVVCVGGMSRMPFVQKKVEDFFQKSPFCGIDPDHAVALGAALSAHGLTYGSETLLLDVTPLSLGLETMGGLVEKIIPRNTPLPALASQEFTTHEDGQGGMVIHVVQGEREFSKDCISLARFELKGLPPLRAGLTRIRIDFVVDAEGLLTVTAIEKTTGLSQHVEVQPTSSITLERLEELVLESQKHGQEDVKQRLEVEKKLRKKSGVP